MTDNNIHVYELTVLPCRPDTIGISWGIKPHSYANFYSLFSIEPNSVVTCDGKQVSIGEFFTWILSPKNIGITFEDQFKDDLGIHHKTHFITMPLE